MFRQANVFAFLFILISVILIAEAQTIVGGYSDVPPSEYKNVQIKLENSNFRTALGAANSCVKVVRIISVSQQVVAGMNYRIVAIVSINGQSKKFCFLLYQSLPPVTYTVNCASELCGTTCKCFDKQ